MKKILTLILFFISAFLNSEEISIYHTSDVHGMYFPRQAKWDKERSTQTIGGFAALASLIQKDKNPKIILDSGDMFQGTPEGNITKGMASINYMNAIGYDAALVGNHDYDFGEENLKNLIKKAKFPFLGANVYYQKDLKNVDYLKPWILKEVNGKKIAILGIAGEHTKTTTLPSNVKHLKFGNEATETEKYIKEIEKQNPDAIIILAHVGIDDSLSQKIVDVSTYTFENYSKHSTIAIARAAKKATAVLGGHNHTGLIYGWKDPITNTLICESYWGLTHTTKLTIDFDDKTKKIKNVKCELIPLWTNEIGEDENIKKIGEEISSQTAKLMDIEIGNAIEDINFESQTLDNPIGNLLTDVTRIKVNADIAFQNAGGVRNVINKGKIKLRDVYQVMPFENTIVKLKMKGKDIYELIKDNLKPNRTSMYISGIVVKYKVENDVENDKVSNIIIEKDGKPIDIEKEYTIATNNYLVNGGSGGRAFNSAISKEDTMILVRDALIEWIKNQKEIKKPDTQRFIKIE